MKKILEGLGIGIAGTLGCAIYIVGWAICVVVSLWFALFIINLIF